MNRAERLGVRQSTGALRRAKIHFDGAHCRRRMTTANAPHTGSNALRGMGWVKGGVMGCRIF